MIKQMTSRMRTSLRMMATLSMALVLSATVPLGTSSVKAQAPTGSTPSSHGGGQKEGLKVHGYWVIEVRNPNGRLVSRTEFENALASQRTLISVLSRTSTMGLWEVDLMSRASDSPWGTTAGGIFNGPNAGRITESGQGPNVYATLTLSKNIDNSIVLSGNATAVQNGSIGRVATSVGSCESAFTGACSYYAFSLQGSLLADAAYDGATMTRTLIDPIPIVQGQIIQVKVVISFS